jgi:hypothetical protein
MALGDGVRRLVKKAFGQGSFDNSFTAPLRSLRRADGLILHEARGLTPASRNAVPNGTRVRGLDLPRTYVRGYRMPPLRGSCREAALTGFALLLRMTRAEKMRPVKGAN